MVRISKRIQFLGLAVAVLALSSVVIYAIGLGPEDMMPPTEKAQRRTQVLIKRRSKPLPLPQVTKQKSGRQNQGRQTQPVAPTVLLNLDSYPQGAKVQFGNIPIKAQTPCRVRIPRLSSFDGTAITLIKHSSIGGFGAIIPLRDINPNKENFLPKVKLEVETVSESNFKIIGHSLLDESEQKVKQFLGLPEMEKRKKKQRPDAPSWWAFPGRGISLRLRKKGLGKEWDDKPKVVDLVRVTALEGGQIAGLHVGSPEQEVRNTFGDPKTFEDAPGELSYLNDGVRFAIENGKVSSIDIARRPEDLKTGLGVFIPPVKPSFWINPVGGSADEDIRLYAASTLKSRFKIVPIYTLADSKAEADYAVSFSLSEPQVTREQRSRTVGRGRNKRTEYYTQVDARCDAYITIRDAENERAKGGFENLHLTGNVSQEISSINPDKGEQDYKRLAAAEAIASVQTKLYEIVPVKGRVFHINHDKNLIYVNLGTRDGVTKDGENIMFDLTVDGAPLIAEKDREDHFCRVDKKNPEVGEDYCVVHLYKMTGNILGRKWDEDYGRLNLVPDPGSGRVGVITRFPREAMHKDSQPKLPEATLQDKIKDIFNLGN